MCAVVESGVPGPPRSGSACAQGRVTLTGASITTHSAGTPSGTVRVSPARSSAFQNGPVATR